MKKFMTAIITVFIISSLFGCSKTNTFNAVVIEHKASTILIAPYEDSDEYKTADRISLAPDNIDVNDFSVGDHVKITYSGKIAESYPAMITSVSSIERIDDDTIPENRKLVMIDGIMYVSTETENTSDKRCGTFDGYITSSVDPNIRPEENGQSNFGDGYGYQIGTEENCIEVCIDNKWIVFKAE